MKEKHKSGSGSLKPLGLKASSEINGFLSLWLFPSSPPPPSLLAALPFSAHLIYCLFTTWWLHPSPFYIFSGPSRFWIICGIISPLAHCYLAVSWCFPLYIWKQRTQMSQLTLSDLYRLCHRPDLESAAWTMSQLAIHLLLVLGHSPGSRVTIESQWY